MYASYVNYQDSLTIVIVWSQVEVAAVSRNYIMVLEGVQGFFTGQNQKTWVCNLTRKKHYL